MLRWSHGSPGELEVLRTGPPGDILSMECLPGRFSKVSLIQPSERRGVLGDVAGASAPGNLQWAGFASQSAALLCIPSSLFGRSKLRTSLLFCPNDRGPLIKKEIEGSCFIYFLHVIWAE